MTRSRLTSTLSLNMISNAGRADLRLGGGDALDTTNVGLNAIGFAGAQRVS